MWDVGRSGHIQGGALLITTTDQDKNLKLLVGERPIHIQVDGGVDHEVAPKLIHAGANVLVAGSYIFKGKNLSDYKNNISLLRNSF